MTPRAARQTYGSRVRLTVRAFAKINLDLRIVGLRSDGFHELRTVFQAVDLHDVLTIEARPGPFALECRHPDVPLNATNLIWRAAVALAHALRREGELRDVKITIEKRIPLQAGLGGGSADAAAALRGLCSLWRVAPSPQELATVAGHVGSDVPFLLGGGVALGLGRGDEIYPLADLGAGWAVVVLPAFGVSTPEAYAWFDERRDRDGTAPPIGLWSLTAATVRNDLEAGVARRHPEIVVIKAALRAQGAQIAAMSGSGSAVFGLFGTRRAAQAAARALAEAGWRSVVTRALSRDECVRWGRPRPAPRRGRADRRPRLARSRGVI